MNPSLLEPTGIQDAERKARLRQAQEQEAEERLPLYEDYQRERQQRLEEERSRLVDPPRAVAEWNFKHNKWGWL